MKKIITALLFASSFLVCVDHTVAQVGIGFGTNGFGIGMHVPIKGNKAERSKQIDRQVNQLKQDLDLNDEQVVKVRGLLIEKERSQSQGRNNVMTREQFDLRMQEILTAGQYAKFNELKQQKREAKKEDIDTKKKEPSSSEEWDDVYR